MSSSPTNPSYVKAPRPETFDNIVALKEPTEPPLRQMLSWIDYGEREVNPSFYHVGEGFLEIGGFSMLVGQSYAGKSTLLTQISINGAIGRAWLFFNFTRP
jgi:RecA-family ATPase